MHFRKDCQPAFGIENGKKAEEKQKNVKMPIKMLAKAFEIVYNYP